MRTPQGAADAARFKKLLFFDAFEELPKNAVFFRYFTLQLGVFYYLQFKFIQFEIEFSFYGRIF